MPLAEGYNPSGYDLQVAKLTPYGGEPLNIAEPEILKQTALVAPVALLLPTAFHVQSLLLQAVPVHALLTTQVVTVVKPFVVPVTATGLTNLLVV